MKRYAVFSAAGFLLWLVLAALSPLAFAAGAGAPQKARAFAPGADSITGTWLTEKGDAQVMFYKKDCRYLGKLAWLKEPNDENGRPNLDEKNPDPRLRGRTVLGLVIIHAVYIGDNLWEGSVYDPDNGKTYGCTIRLAAPDAMRLRGYWGISLLGRTETWKRVK